MAQIEIFEEINAGIIIAKTTVDGRCYATEITGEIIDCQYMTDGAGDESIGWEAVEDTELYPECIKLADVTEDCIKLAPTLNLERIGNAGEEFIKDNVKSLDIASLQLVAKQVDNWMHPVFHEVEMRAGVKMEIDEEFEHYIIRCGDKIGIELF